MVGSSLNFGMLTCSRGAYYVASLLEQPLPMVVVRYLNLTERGPPGPQRYLGMPVIGKIPAVGKVPVVGKWCGWEKGGCWTLALVLYAV